MKSLCIYAGPLARQHLERQSLQAQDIGVVPGAAGGPKGLILGPLDRFIFGEWLGQSTQPVHLVGASIGAWRMATACLNDPVKAFERLEHDYIAQDFALPPGQKRHSADAISAQFGQNLQDFYGGRVQEVLAHPRYKLHVLTSRGRHVLRREHKVATPLGYLGAFISNSVHRKAMGAWLERVVFSSQGAALPFATTDYKTRQVALNADNFQPVLQASCSIPFLLRSVANISGAPAGAYWDGGITDYHLHLNYTRPDAAAPATGAGLVLYPHFQKAVVPSWLDKSLKWRHKSTAFLDNMVLLAPNPEWVKTLPNGKLPDRHDFTHYAHDFAGRAKAWQGATSASMQMADEWQAWLERPDMRQVQAL